MPIEKYTEKMQISQLKEGIVSPVEEQCLNHGRQSSY